MYRYCQGALAANSGKKPKESEVLGAKRLSGSKSPALAHSSCSYWLGLCVPLSANEDAGDLAPARPLSAPRDEAETEQPASKSTASRKPCRTRRPAPKR